jgi:hypothetical protein
MLAASLAFSEVDQLLIPLFGRMWPCPDCPVLDALIFVRIKELLEWVVYVAHRE